jgi:hypothetical protein
MGSQDSFFEALGGETPIGFFTHSSTLSHGVDVQGNQVGVKGTCQGPVGDGVQGFGSGNFSGVAGFGGSTDGIGDGTGVFGIGGGTDGPGVRGIGAGGPNTSPGGINTSSNVGVFGQGGEGSTPGIGGGTGVVGIGGGTTGPGVIGIGGGGPNHDGPEPETSRPNVGVFGRAGDSGADGVQGVCPAPLPQAAPDSPRGDGAFLSAGAGVHGISTDPDGNGIFGETGSGPAAFAIWGIASGGYAGFFEGRVFVSGDLIVGGAKSAVVPFSDGSHRRLYCMESPESWFEDFGIGHLVNGQAEVQLDSDFASVVNSDNYHVFVNEYDDNNALYVTKRTSTGFGVRAKSSKTASGTFSYRVVAKRKDSAGKRLERVVIPTEKLQAARSARLARQKK